MLALTRSVPPGSFLPDDERSAGGPSVACGMLATISVSTVMFFQAVSVPDLSSSFVEDLRCLIFSLVSMLPLDSNDEDTFALSFLREFSLFVTDAFGVSWLRDSDESCRAVRGRSFSWSDAEKLKYSFLRS